MTDTAHVETLLYGLSDKDMRRLFVEIFRYVLKDARFGRAIAEEASKNMGGGFFFATTPTVANTEFSIPHNFGKKPYLLIPVMPLDSTTASIVRLQVARPADAIRVYLKSPDTDAPVFVYLEG